MGSRVFVIRDFDTQRQFQKNFLESPEFTVKMLKQLVKITGATTSKKKKNELVEEILDGLDSEKITSEDILLEYVTQPREWLSFKTGKYKELPVLGSYDELVSSRGAPGWHGPIANPNEEGPKCWYILIQESETFEKIEPIENSSKEGEEEDGEDDERRGKIVEFAIRWHAIAAIYKDHVAVSWNGFSTSKEEMPKSYMAYPCWKDIRREFKSLADELKAKWIFPDLLKLTMHHILEKYSPDDHAYANYQHIRVRAEAAGMALSARSSSGVTEYNREWLMGLKALSKKLATVAIRSYRTDYLPEDIELAQSKVLITILREWGTKSYEFSLDFHTNEGPQKVCRAHIYFGVRQDKTQDGFPHARCFKSYGGSDQTLEFLLKEMKDLESEESGV